MRKFNSILLALLLISVNLNAAPMSGKNPYMFGFGNAARPVEDLRGYAKPNQMSRILPNRIIQATDSSGNKQFYTPTGKMALSIAKDGSRTYSLNGVQQSMDKNGKLLSVSKNVSGTNWIEVTNEFGEIISYKETDIGGKIIAEYDKDKNQTKQYVYDEYGKNISSIANLMTQGKTVFDDNGNPSYELDYEGNRMAKYEYDDLNNLISKTDAYGNVTKFDAQGNMTHTENKDGIVLTSYIYDYDKYGNYVLVTAFDPTTKSTTYFKDGKQQYTKNYAGAIITDYFWNGSKLIATFNRENQETTWFDIDGRTLYTTFNEQLISEYLYYNGQLVGLYDARVNQVTIFKNERRELVLQLGEYGDAIKGETQVIKEIGAKESEHIWGPIETVEGFEPYKPGPRPTAEDIIKWIKAGLIDNKYITSPL
ncbi:MAG: RHS repeat protein [Endomicrobium sp.]|jgi:YD repeat-containing protein|nr:RHS repeat protein [Endomicrobium sp.]